MAARRVVRATRGLVHHRHGAVGFHHFRGHNCSTEGEKTSVATSAITIAGGTFIQVQRVISSIDRSVAEKLNRDRARNTGAWGGFFILDVSSRALTHRPEHSFVASIYKVTAQPSSSGFFAAYGSDGERLADGSRRCSGSTYGAVFGYLANQWSDVESPECACIG